MHTAGSPVSPFGSLGRLRAVHRRHVMCRVRVASSLRHHAASLIHLRLVGFLFWRQAPDGFPFWCWLPPLTEHAERGIWEWFWHMGPYKSYLEQTVYRVGPP